MHQQKRHQQHQPRLFESLRANDLKGLVDHIFTIDQFKSKMGEDKDVVVLGFRVSDKFPAIDLMEFVEKGYTYILDADMSTGEERDGRYQVFVELERSPKLGMQITDILEGVGQLCDCTDWRFRYHKDIESLPVSEEALNEHIPNSPEAYEAKILESSTKEVAEFFDQGATDTVTLTAEGDLTFTKPYSGELSMHLDAIGFYESVKNKLQGAIQLDESSRGQSLFLEKYLGNYEINKIDGKFLIRNGNRAVIVSKNRW